jgi:GAF domain-containing protein
MNAFVHPFEEQRLVALRRQHILDTKPDRRFDRLVFMAAQMMRVPIATLAFVDEGRIWLKSKVGTTATDLSRDAFCGSVILQQSPMVIEDATTDALYKNNEYVVGAPFVRFYAGVSVCSRDNLPIGVLCVVDTRPRQIDPLQLNGIIAWAREAEELLDVGWRED